MVKDLISIIVSAAFLTGIAIAEDATIKKSFGEFSTYAQVLYLKEQDESATVDDALILQKNWLKFKSKLHVYIPHNEIKEMDLWVSECVGYTKSKNFKEAKSKLEVIIELTQQIPKTFKFDIENIL